MGKLLLYYSFSGNTSEFAVELAEKNSFEIKEIKDATKRNAFWAFTVGCYNSLTQRVVDIDLSNDLSEYHDFILCFPVWAGMPSPQFNSVLKKLPQESKIEIYLISDSGSTKRKRRRIEDAIADCNMELVDYHDIKTPAKKNKKD